MSRIYGTTAAVWPLNLGSALAPFASFLFWRSFFFLFWRSCLLPALFRLTLLINCYFVCMYVCIFFFLYQLFSLCIVVVCGTIVLFVCFQQCPSVACVNRTVLLCCILLRCFVFCVLCFVCFVYPFLSSPVLAFLVSKAEPPALKGTMDPQVIFRMGDDTRSCMGIRRSCSAQNRALLG